MFCTKLCVYMTFQVMQNQNTLVEIQPSMKTDLLTAVKSLQSHVHNFCNEYNLR